MKFGIRHACSTVRRYMVKRRPGPTDSQAWKSFLKNQVKALWSCDFFVQHTVGYQVLAALRQGDETTFVTLVSQHTSAMVRLASVYVSDRDNNRIEKFIPSPEANVPTVSTAAVTNISTSAASSGGNVTSDGGAPANLDAASGFHASYIGEAGRRVIGIIAGVRAQ